MSDETQLNHQKEIDAYKQMVESLSAQLQAHKELLNDCLNKNLELRASSMVLQRRLQTQSQTAPAPVVADVAPVAE